MRTFGTHCRIVEHIQHLVLVHHKLVGNTLGKLLACANIVEREPHRRLLPIANLARKPQRRLSLLNTVSTHTAVRVQPSHIEHSGNTSAIVAQLLLQARRQRTTVHARIHIHHIAPRSTSKHKRGTPRSQCQKHNSHHANYEPLNSNFDISNFHITIFLMQNYAKYFI